jgi:DNA-directed RNA polymerase subunit RPC12/RpoP
MQFFKRKEQKEEAAGFSPACPHCRSTHTKIITHSASEQPDYVKTWRGERYVSCRCLDCGQDFYVDEPKEGLADEDINNDEIVADEEALRAAEEELKREIDEANDRRCW